MSDAGVALASADEARKVWGSATWRPLQTKGTVLSGMTDSEVPGATSQPVPTTGKPEIAIEVLFSVPSSSLSFLLSKLVLLHSQSYTFC